jgi:TolA-binding protein
MAEAPASSALCAWQSKVLRNALSLNDKRDQIVELERLGAVVDRAPPPARERTDECRAGFHNAARELALVWHREGQKTRDADTYRLAERAYRLFLAHFPGDRDAYEMTYYLGELLWSLGRWRDAAEIYTQVVAAKPEGKYARDAAQAAMLAWQNVLSASGPSSPREIEQRHRDDDRVRAQQGRLAPRAIPADEQKLIAALQTFQRYLPDAPEVPAAIYREAYINYDYNHFDRAEALFRQIVDRFPKHQLASFAANLYLDSLNAQGKTEELGVAVRDFLERPALGNDSELVSQMLSLLSDVLEQEARDQERRGDPKECGRSFAAAAETWPSHERHAQRLWNAAQCFQNAHLIGQALKLWQALRKDHPRDALAQQALFREGAGYHQLAYYEKAADAYEAFAKKFPGEPQAVGALGNAIAFREGLDEGDQAIGDMRSFVSFYGGRKPADAAGVFFQMSEVYESQGKPDELTRHLREYLERWGRQGGVDREVEAHFQLGELAWRGSCAHGAADGSCVSVERQTSSRGREVLITARRKYARERRTQCGPATKTRIVAWGREAGHAAAAEEHFRRAIALWKAGDAGNPIAGSDREARRAAGAYAAAGATFYLAEKSYEDFLRVKFPQNLDFTRPRPQDSARRQAAVRKRLEDSQRRFTSYLGEKAAGLERARALYLDVIHQRQAQWAIAAAARIGQLHQDFAGQLYTAEIPKDLPEADAWGNRPRDLYCEELEDRAGKIEAQAIEGFAACLTAATQQSWYNEWSRLCERELNQLQPVEFPLSSEIKPAADNTPTSIAAVPLIRELKLETP